MAQISEILEEGEHTDLRKLFYLHAMAGMTLYALANPAVIRQVSDYIVMEATTRVGRFLLPSAKEDAQKISQKEIVAWCLLEFNEAAARVLKDIHPRVRGFFEDLSRSVEIQTKKDQHPFGG